MASHDDGTVVSGVYGLIESSRKYDNTLGVPKVLFVGEIHSTHAQSWMDMLHGEPIEARALNLTSTAVPNGYPFPIIGPRRTLPRRSLSAEATVSSRLVSRLGTIADASHHLWEKAVFGDRIWQHLLRRVVRDWKPDIIHCFGLLAAGRFVAQVLGPDDLKNSKLVIQLRGGSDLALNHADMNLKNDLSNTLRKADAILSDNALNFQLMERMGLAIKPWPGLERVPGTGGIDIDAEIFKNVDPPSMRQEIFWPKAYESPWSKGLPILEALRIVWDRIQPFHIHMVMAVNELPSWVSLLPEAAQGQITLYGRIPRNQVFKLMRRARVMIAPSLIDGTPNAMWEAMAAGCVPIVSPLETIVPLVRDNENVIMARNLYPNEIADALARAMLDDSLVDRIAATNKAVIGQLAGKETFRPKVLNFYKELASEHRR